MICIGGLHSFIYCEQLNQYSAAIHVHSRFSNGKLTVDSLAEAAHDRELDVLILTDSFLTTATYGFWPFDRIVFSGLNKMVRPGVKDHGLENYLSTVARVDERFTDLIVVPAVEVKPYYYWKGSPLTELVLYNFDRHLLVFGLNRDELDNLPVIHNETWQNGHLDWMLLVPPSMIVTCGLFLLFFNRKKTVRLKYYRIRNKRTSRIPGILLVMFGLLVGWFNYPFTRLFDPFTGKHSIEPYQKVIDYVLQQGGAVYWSYPEARYDDVFAGGARMVSAPHLDDLMTSRGYHGFEGLYGDRITATDPGSAWDQILLQYCRGTRESPSFVSTGIDFHGFDLQGGWYELKNGLTMLLMPDLSEESVVKALREGHCYATFQNGKPRLRLETFQIQNADGIQASQGGLVTGSGPVTVHIRLDWINQGPVEPMVFNLDLISDGHIVQQWSEELPFRSEYPLELSKGKHFVRLAAKCGRAYRILSNPVFVEVK